MIGQSYTYPGKSKEFILSAIDGWIYIFQCGHRVTDNVFADMKQIQKYNQLTLF